MALLPTLLRHGSSFLNSDNPSISAVASSKGHLPVSLAERILFSARTGACVRHVIEREQAARPAGLGNGRRPVLPPAGCGHLAAPCLRIRSTEPGCAPRA